LVAADAADAAADLVGEGLEGEALIDGGEGAGNTVAGGLGALGFEEDVDGFLEAAAEEVFVAFEGDGGGIFAGFCVREAEREVEAVDGVEEKEGADAVVEISAGAAEGVEGVGFGEELGEGEFPAGGVEGLVADGGVGRSDEIEEGHGRERRVVR